MFESSFGNQFGEQGKGIGQKFDTPLPSWLKHLWTFKQGLNSKKGPDLSFLYPTGTLPGFAGGVRASTVPPIDPEKGWFGGPGYTNLFTTAPSGAAVILLTAQKYCLQCVGGSVDAGAYGTATPSTPLVFTASAGNTTFTPTGVTAWQLTASGGYVFPVIPHNTTVVSSASGATYYAGWPMDYNTKAGQEMLECLRGVPDGTELVTNGTFDTDITGWITIGTPTLAWDAGRLKITSTAAGGGGAATTAIPVVSGSRYLIKATGVSVTPIQLRVGTSQGGSELAGITLASGVELAVEITATTTFIYLYLSLGATAAGQVAHLDNVSIQKLNPAVFTLMDQTYMGVGSGELPAGVDSYHNLVTSANSVFIGALFFAKTAGGASIVVQGSDGSTFLFTGATYNRDVLIRRIVQTKADGSQYRIGYQIIGVNASIQWSSWVNFDGSMNPLTILKMFYSTTTPNYKQLVALSNKSLSDAEIARVFNYAN